MEYVERIIYLNKCIVNWHQPSRLQRAGVGWTWLELVGVGIDISFRYGEIMIEFQIEKVKSIKDLSITMEHESRLLFRELCDVVLELLAKEKMRESEKE